MTGRAPLQFGGLDPPLLRYGKTRNKKRATCFATFAGKGVEKRCCAFYHPQKQILQPYLLRDRIKHVETDDVARFNTHILACPATNKVARFVFVGGKTRNIAIQLAFQQC